MGEKKLSYILTTYNKLPYLKSTLPLLLQNVGEEEEIIITDGGSQDGSAEYIKAAIHSKANCHFICEKDFGEAHGLNKALLIARGDIIKVITDDDFFDYRAIRLCRDFMLANGCDLIGGNGVGCRLTDADFTYHDYAPQYQQWLKDRKTFFFSGLSLMLSRRSIPLLGLFHTGIKMVDLEYCLRATSLPIKMAYYPGYMYCNIVNPSSNSAKFFDLFYEEQVKIDLFYNSQRIRHKLNSALGRTKPPAIQSIDVEQKYAELAIAFYKLCGTPKNILHA
jgi:glycosyltransferase involved in cell wall biosynthesis